jgi:hypothetical protein
MKKLCAIIIILLVGAVSLWADLPPRTFELGFNTGGSFANNYIGITEVFQKTIEIDLTKEPKDLYFDLGADFDLFININIKDKMGFGFFAGVDAMGQFSFPKDIQDFLLGNRLDKTYEGEIGTSGAAFLEAGAHGYFSIKKFRISVRPAYYFPLAYLKPNIRYKIITRNGLVEADFEYDLALYTPFALGEDLDNLSFNNVNMSSIEGRGGVDLALAVDYPILPKLDVGAFFTHIPLFPAELTNFTVIKGGKKLSSTDLIQDLIDGKDDLLEDITVESSHASLQIFRPFKFGINAVYTPFKFKVFSLSLIPQIGYAYNAIYVKPHSFEGSAKVRLGLFNIMRSNPLLGFTFSTGYEDKLWRHGVDFALNLRLLELDIGAAVKSESFKNSFHAAGFDINVGLIIGW